MSDEIDSPPPDGVEPDSSSPLPGVAFSFVVGSEAFDYVIERHGIVPTKEIRLTMVQELYTSAPNWVDSTIAQMAAKITNAN